VIFDFEKYDLPVGKAFDVCIAGAGAAGLALACQLVRRGRSVLLLEGGGRNRWERKSQALNKSHILGETFHGAHSGRFRALGGSTTAWGGFVMELDDLDFQSRDWVEGSSWPFSKSELKRFYIQARELEDTDTFVHDDDDQVWELAKTPKPSLGDEMQMYFCHRVPEKNFARRFADIIGGDRLTVLLHANVVEMIPSEDKRRISSLRFRTVGGKEGTCSAKHVALCLGGIESSRFLLNQKFAPWNEHGLVGRHFHDHVHCFAADVGPTDLGVPNWPYGRFYTPKWSMTPEAQRKYRLLNVTGVVKYADGIFDTLRTGIKVVTGPTSAIGLKEFIRMTPRVPGTLWYLLKSRRDPDYVAPWGKLKLSVSCEQSPLSESRITLSSKRDKLGLLKADITWRISEQEIDTIRQFVALTKEAFAANGIADVIPDPDLHTDKIIEKCEDTFHHCGGTRMAARRQDGVVDPDLRLNGVENAYICSASVFPTSGIANPTHTIVALAARLAEHLDNTLAVQENDMPSARPRVSEKLSPA
jgi:hypothetical protein